MRGCKGDNNVELGYEKIILRHFDMHDFRLKELHLFRYFLLRISYYIFPITHFLLHIPYYTFPFARSLLHISHYTFPITHFLLHIPYYTIPIKHSLLHIPYYAFPIPHSLLYISYYTIPIKHFLLNISHYTFPISRLTVQTPPLTYFFSQFYVNLIAALSYTLSYQPFTYGKPFRVPQMVFQLGRNHHNVSWHSHWSARIMNFEWRFN